MSSLAAAYHIAFFQLISARKLFALILLGLTPAIFGLLIRLTVPAAQEESVLGAPPELSLFTVMYQLGMVQVVMIATALFGATGLIADEAENKTLIYLTVRPISKTALFLGRFGAYLATGIIVVAISFLATLFAAVELPAIAENSTALLRFALALPLGILAYGALFALFGTWFKRALILALIWAFGWESLVALIPGSLNEYTLNYYIRGISPFPPSFGPLPTEYPPLSQCVIALLIATAVLLAACLLVFHQREYSSPDTD